MSITITIEEGEIYILIDALSRLRESKVESKATLVQVIRELEEGHPVALMAPGARGIRAAQEMMRNLRSQIEDIDTLRFKLDVDDDESEEDAA